MLYVCPKRSKGSLAEIGKWARFQVCFLCGKYPGFFGKVEKEERTLL